MRLKIQSIILICFAFTGSTVSSQTLYFTGKISWQGVVTEQLPDGRNISFMQAPEVHTDIVTGLPLVQLESDIPPHLTISQLELDSVVYEPCNAAESAFIAAAGTVNTEILLHHTAYYYRKKPFKTITFIPVRKNAARGTFEKVTWYRLRVLTSTEDFTSIKGQQRSYAEHSVLQEGNWFKFRVKESGIYKLGYHDLIQAGMDLSNADPRKIRVFGNGGYMLPEKTSDPRPDDLLENAVYIHGEEDGIFNEDDYLLFYGLSPHQTVNLLGFINQEIHLYDDYNYYFLTLGEEFGKRISTALPVQSPVTGTVTSYTEYQFIESDNINLIESGKAWYMDEFGEVLAREYQFEIEDIIPEKPLTIKFNMANRTLVNDYMEIRINEGAADTLTLTSIQWNSQVYARPKKKTYVISPAVSHLKASITYHPYDGASRMWLDYIYLNATCALHYRGGQLDFRDLSSVGDEAITRFIISGTNPSTAVWDVTDYLNPVSLPATFTDGQTTFVAATSTLREFVAFDGSEFMDPEFVGQIQNQDLHGQDPVDYVIVTHPLFIDQAKRLKDLHEAHHGFSILLTTPAEIFHEFSSGKQDPTAIRDLMKMLYDRSGGNEPRYLLLFGDGSFDPKDRLEHNTNFIPTFQTEESWIGASSFVVEDYYGLLDEDEGLDAYGYLDIGIGRFPVQTQQEAKIIVDKIERYLQSGEPHFGNWRAKICIVADDEDSNLHIKQADSLMNGFGFVPPAYNQQKIYLDAYPQVKTPSGNRYPDVNNKLSEQMDEGVLIMNYIGHGGTGGWAHERILQQNDILNWTNIDRLPVFITATCEFSRFDEPEIVSAGERVLLHEQGGGIALFTTTRLAYSQSNFKLNERIYSRAFSPVKGEMPFLGDLIRESKPPGMSSTRNFVLLGDPGIQMAYPDYEVRTLTINGNPSGGNAPDTLRALQEVEISGEIVDLAGIKVSDFNGTIYPLLYDKKTVYKTLANDPASYPMEFTNQDKIVWQGKATVMNGDFTFRFIVPQDIAMGYGTGKLSYYAAGEHADAFGSYHQFQIGGNAEDASVDYAGPEIELFINDLSFVSGELTHNNPLLLAYLHDTSGINISDNGIGHRITAVLNDDYSTVYDLNAFFEPALDDYSRGTVTYPFRNLPDGYYTLTLKAWDGQNNSSEASIEFVIDMDARLTLTEVMNFPNPFQSQTTFQFRHTKPGQRLDILLEIYSLSGRYLLSYRTELYSSGIESQFLVWDGRDVNGAKLPAGIYIYNLTVTDELGNAAKQQQKLIIL